MKQFESIAKSFNWKFWLGLLISALFTYLAFQKIEVSRLWGIIQSAKPMPLLFIALITFFQYVIRAWRWEIFLEPLKKTSFGNRFSSILIGFAANCVLPARLGEFIRAGYLGRKEQISGSSTFGTLVVERLCDGFTLLLVLLIGLMGTTFPAEWRSASGSLQVTGISLLLFYVLVIFFIIGFKFKSDLYLKILNKTLFFLPHRFRSRIVDMVWNFSLGLVLVKDFQKWVRVIGFSLLLWFTSLCQIALTEQSIGLDLPFMATFLVLAMGSFGVMIPSAPGFIGTFHLSVQYGFIFYGIGKEEALSAAILWHAFSIIPTILFGFVAFLLVQASPAKLSEHPKISPSGEAL